MTGTSASVHSKKLIFLQKIKSTAQTTRSFETIDLHKVVEWQSLLIFIINLLPGKNIFLGDWNSKHHAWGSIISNANGNLLFQTIKNLNLDSQHLIIHSPHKPTHIHANKTVNLLDFIITNNIQKPFNPTVLFEFQSDHLPIVLDLNSTKTKENNPTTTSTNWKKFYERFQNHIHKIPTIQENTHKHIDTQIKLITDLFY
ncbi:hypothetical protein J437_LFUL017599 [Ladona fulva]|uniref:Endonuclease/exonuclease/phosphatase domain-containing protein n=1 Tax=Ladona fulva TaxID=123851 RepID=A0A8K0KMN9_LADFU|nr:hypothetical protein J437_LFUL017599 [Ladona fulva]